MKAKSGKIIKICALSLGLLMLGGATITPITKVYAEEPGRQNQQELKTVKVHFNKEYPSEYVLYIWYNGENGNEVKEYNFSQKDEYGPYFEFQVHKSVNKINYIIADKRNNSNWIKDDNRDRSFDLGNGNEVWIRSKDERSWHSKPKIEDLIKDKQLPTKPIKVWKGDAFKWVDAIDTSKKDDVNTDIDVRNALANIKDVANLDDRNSKDASSFKDGNSISKDGKVKVTFNDDSSVQVDTKLYVSEVITPATNTNTPEGAIDIELYLGKGVKDELNNEGHRLFNKYKAKPDIDASKEKIALVGTIFASNVKTTNPKQKVKWLNGKKEENYIVSKTNNVFTATAIDQTIIRINYHRPDKKIDGWKVKIKDGKGKEYSQDFTESDKNGNYYAEVSLDGKLDSVSYIIKNEKTGEVEKNGTKEKDGKRSLTIDKNKDKTEASVEASKKPLVPSVKPSHSKSLDYKIVPEKKTEKKSKPSEKVLKSYKNLRISREKNVVAVKAAKLLLEIAPERVKDVKTNLINLIAKSESLVKNADTILEKLEAKYEF
ncbi:pullulanase-associated domain-containing protein [Anaerococcus degeneri]|uniref:Pullulanase carbohydrate-binding module 41 domain-containing protein n=1 Tax=Anaerococcus degeneri TaxID=361500 RepID=A0ABS7YYP2_9FIRM|nr:pullulanase-associated domain-containing protein [Anaerococcus degeneri]MBP2014635.1 riboflavin synthase [Anaerococcus degeneri]MCA2096848.1 hypothetical protein [Anaerococcus degeneri]